MFYSLKIYNELKRQEINLPWTAQSPKTFTANCKSYNKSSSGFTAIIKFEFMHIVSPVPLREYNVKFTVTLFSYESDNLHKWNTDRRERYQESLIWIDFTYLLVYLLFLLLYATGLCCICSNKNTLPFSPPKIPHEPFSFF